MNLKLFVCCILPAQLCFAVPTAVAHGEADAAQHGGQYTGVEGHHGVEMVSTEDVLIFFLTENGKPMDLTGASFKAVVQTDAGTNILSLTVENGTLKTRLEKALPAGAKVVLSGQGKNGHTLQTRFVKQ